jgi:transcriptional regulator with XRE-family HTH domain
MDTAGVLRRARRRAGMSQRALAVGTGVAQPTIARIESGREDPRIATLERLLHACGEGLGAGPVAGAGVDRSGIRALLALTPAQRLATLVAEGPALERFAHARRLP